LKFSKEYSGVFEVLESAKSPAMPETLAEETMKRIEKQRFVHRNEMLVKITLARIGNASSNSGYHLFGSTVIESSMRVLYFRQLP